LLTELQEMSELAAEAYSFGDFRLDRARFALLRNGQSLKLERKPMELLLFLVENRERLVGRDEIALRLWKGEVFVDTEHGINTAVRKIRDVLGDDPEKPRYLQTVTGKGYCFIAPVEVEMPQGVVAVQEESIPATPAADEPARSVPRRPLWRVGTVVFLSTFLLCGAIWLWWRPFSARVFHRGQPAITSVAVLPLSNFSGDPGQDYFADGMTDELITMLARDSTLSITSRTSAMRFKGSSRPMREIAQALHVDGIVEGSVSRSGNQVHMTLQLIRADADTHVWAESYDRDLNDIAALPDEAARAIAARLNSSSALRVPARYVNPEAHDAYLRGRYYWIVGRNEDSGKAFQRAVELQPDYAAGWAGLSQYYSAGTFYGVMDPTEVMPKAKAAAEKAVQLDETLPQAHEVMAASAFFGDWDGPRALEEVTRATDLEPEYGEAMHLHALILSAMGRYQEALKVQRQGTGIDPTAHPGALAEILMYARQYDEAQKDAEMRRRDFPAATDLMNILSEVYRRKGMYRESAEMLANLAARRRGETRPDAEVLNTFKAGGYRQVLRWQIALLEKLAKSRYISPAIIARYHAELGEREDALALLDLALRKRDPWLLFIQTDPAFDSLHNDPRYVAIVKRVGLIPAN
jgi:TolB-like protein/DNA-binding winged helix-turn-helix (wHTH) protein